MASNLFGTPITDESLKRMPEYGYDRKINRLNKAKVALETKNEGGKDIRAREYADNMRQRIGDGIMCLIYNATGGSVKFVTRSQVDGNLGPSPYPLIIANGQWGVFVTGMGRNSDGAHAFVYAGKNANGVEYQWMYTVKARDFGWCFTEIRPSGYFPVTFPVIGAGYGPYDSGIEKLKTPVHQAHESGCSSLASAGGTKSPFFEAIMTLTPILDD